MSISNEIITSIVNGDRHAFKRLYELLNEKVYNTALSYTQNEKDAEEITQDVFLKIHKNAASVKGQAQVSTWVYRITVNTSLNYIKKRERSTFLRFESMLKEKPDFEHPGEEDYLDVHNGRFCVTPEYPNGIYAYFSTVDDNWNSTYPYVVGPTFYGISANRSVNSINEATTVYDATTYLSELEFRNLNINVFPNPSADLIAIQINDLAEEDF